MVFCTAGETCGAGCTVPCGLAGCASAGTGAGVEACAVCGCGADSVFAAIGAGFCAGVFGRGIHAYTAEQISMATTTSAAAGSEPERRNPLSPTADHSSTLGTSIGETEGFGTFTSDCISGGGSMARCTWTASSSPSKP